MNKKRKNRLMDTDNIFDDLGLDQSDELMARAHLLNRVGTLIKESKLSQRDIANEFGISQPKVSLLVSGRLSDFSTETLIHYLSVLGCNIEIRVKKPRSRVGILRRKGKIAVH